jgi:hypothetical protein
MAVPRRSKAAGPGSERAQLTLEELRTTNYAAAGERVRQAMPSGRGGEAVIANCRSDKNGLVKEWKGRGSGYEGRKQQRQRLECSIQSR